MMGLACCQLWLHILDRGYNPGDTPVISVGLREMKANLSRYVRLVQEQQTDVSVTIHGRTVARLVPVSTGGSRARDVLVSLAAQGLLELPEEPGGRRPIEPVVPQAGGQSLSAMIIEDRR